MFLKSSNRHFEYAKQSIGGQLSTLRSINRTSLFFFVVFMFVNAGVIVINNVASPIDNILELLTLIFLVFLVVLMIIIIFIIYHHNN